MKAGSYQQAQRQHDAVDGELDREHASIVLGKRGPGQRFEPWQGQHEVLPVDGGA